MQPFPPTVQDSGDAEGRVGRGVSCRKCGYDLRGADAGGRCPECGTAVALSARPDLLRFADPAWVATLARGVRLILWGTLVAAVAGAGGPAAFGDTPLGNLVATAGGLVRFVGAWLLTERNPSTFGRDETLTARKWVRVALGASLLATFLHALPIPVALPPLLVASAVLELGAQLAEAAGEFAVFRYLGVLADRVPDAKLARRARQLGWWFAGCILALALGVGSTALVTLSVPRGALPPVVLAVAAIAVAGVGVLLLVVMIWALVVQYRMGKALRAQAALAREAWASEAGTRSAATPAPSADR